MSVEHVIKICKTLEKEGKKPSTALVKTRLASPIALAIVLKGLKMYSENPDVEISETPIIQEARPCCSCSPPCKTRIEALEKDVETLKEMLKTSQALERV